MGRKKKGEKWKEREKENIKGKGRRGKEGKMEEWKEGEKGPGKKQKCKRRGEKEGKKG